MCVGQPEAQGAAEQATYMDYAGTGDRSVRSDRAERALHIRAACRQDR